MRSLRFAWWWKLLGFVMVAALILASLVPPPSSDLRLSDKQLHFMSYAWLSFWFGAIYLKMNFGRIALALIAIGIGIEFAQSATSYRSFEMADMIADGLGTCAGLLLAATPFGGLLVLTERRLLRRG